MTLNAVIRCSTCNKVSKKLGSQDGVCSQCLEIIELKKQIEEQTSCKQCIHHKGVYIGDFMPGYMTPKKYWVSHCKKHKKHLKSLKICDDFSTGLGRIIVKDAMQFLYRSKQIFESDETGDIEQWIEEFMDDMQVVLEGKGTPSMAEAEGFI